ncbi:MAG: uracil-DNA glycosylase [Ignavibacteriaceae bacterium]|nr:uracil-DNA glycosylase [Ignavibacteriaceae bacterium]HRI47977.1 uracil-DNA glycosylase [Ignavibacteriaceae bacterium]
MDKEELINILKLQQEIFGDELFTTELKPTQQNNIEKIETKKSEQSNLKDFITSTSLSELNSLICQCQQCILGSTRKNFVFGVGNPNARVMVIGEGPGADEDEQGEPFVGRAGRLLNDILKAINFERSEVYIANVVKCRPPGNRTPTTDEMDTCLPYLKKQIDLIKPSLILCLGLTAALGILKKKDSLTNLRGKVFDFENAKVMVTYHPAALLRNPNWKRGCWEDVQKFRKLYDEMFTQ